MPLLATACFADLGLGSSARQPSHRPFLPLRENAVSVVSLFCFGGRFLSPGRHLSAGLSVCLSVCVCPSVRPPPLSLSLSLSLSPEICSLSLSLSFSLMRKPPSLFLHPLPLFSASLLATDRQVLEAIFRQYSSQPIRVHTADDPETERLSTRRNHKA